MLMQGLEREHESRVASMRSEFNTAQRSLSDRLANQEDAVRLLQDQLTTERRRADSAQTDRERVRDWTTFAAENNDTELKSSFTTLLCVDDIVL